MGRITASSGKTTGSYLAPIKAAHYISGPASCRKANKHRKHKPINQRRHCLGMPFLCNAACLVYDTNTEYAQYRIAGNLVHTNATRERDGGRGMEEATRGTDACELK